jgi:hypothetical protein
MEVGHRKSTQRAQLLCGSKTDGRRKLYLDVLRLMRHRPTLLGYDSGRLEWHNSTSGDVVSSVDYSIDMIGQRVHVSGEVRAPWSPTSDPRRTGLLAVCKHARPTMPCVLCVVLDFQLGLDHNSRCLVLLTSAAPLCLITRTKSRSRLKGGK